MITIKRIKGAALPAIAAGLLFTSCNKDVKQFDAPVVPVYPASTGSIAKTLAANPNDSLYYRMVIKGGQVATLNDSTRTYTIFATDNNGMKIFINAASGGLIPLTAPDATFSGFIQANLSAATCAGFIQYNTVGQSYPLASIPAVFPNFPLPSLIQLDPTAPFVRMQIFPQKGTPYSYVNTVPVTGTEVAATNGVIYHMATLITTPSFPSSPATLKTMIAAEPTLTYYRAAIARADSGSVNLGKFDSLMNYGLTNMTLLAPNDAAFQSFISQLVYAKTFQLTNSAAIATATAAGAVAAGPAFLSTNNVTTADVKGIIAYHFLSSLTTNTATPYQPNIRVFSNNIPVSATPKLIFTLVNNSVAVHPGVAAFTTYIGTGPVIASLSFAGLGNFPTSYTGTVPPLTPVFGAPFTTTPATAVTKDKLAVNGVYHIIDKVLLPINLP